MNKTHIVFLICGILLAGCTSVDVTELDRISLADEDLALKTSGQRTTVDCAEYNESVVEFIYETELALIRVPVDIMISSLSEFHREHPHIKDDLSLIEHLSKAIVDVKAKDLEGSLQDRSFYRIGDLLEQGKCKVYNKQASKYESEIQMAEFGYYFGPLTASGGKIYLFGGTETVFLEVQEWIS